MSVSLNATALPNRHAQVVSSGSYLPDRVVTNHELAPAIDSSDEWIQQRSGIIERRFADRDVTAVDMAEAAAKRALEGAGLTGADIDAVIVATVTHNMITPSASAMVADRIGATPALAFDIQAACSGFCYGIGVVTDMIRSGSIRNAVVVGVEKLTDFLDLTDRGCAFIFADGAGAFVITDSDTPRISPTLWGSDGSGWDLIRQAPGFDEIKYAHDDGAEIDLAGMRMEGRKVFKWASFEVPKYASKVLDLAGITPDELDIFVPHQANNRITDGLVKQMSLSESVTVARAIQYQGNTSAASVPLAFDDLVRKGQVSSNQTALTLGFGAGLTYAGQVILTP